MTDIDSNDPHWGAVYCLGMASAIYESATGTDIPSACYLDVSAFQDLEEVWQVHRNAPLSEFARRLNALHHWPVQYGTFVRPNAHLICFDLARHVREAVWSAVDPDGFQRAMLAGTSDTERIDLTHFGERWPA